ncbi:hypothetical protein TeGR_g8242 [Tetraparma gracilis]|uniref:Cilia- and flagella-associated protein 36 n=1 Tax=Tetraparma gracilis TaxID=2962635 RepID=A0ABQ6M737_9STRA|nr:hypothetical protein TeGR_g8242 [Tetraparma gracilis]
MPKEESKDAGESKDSGDDSEVPPLVAGFAQFCTSEEFQDVLTQFEDDHCSVFRGVDLEGEQELEWTDLHRQYVEIVEERMEKFCADEGATTESLFEQLSMVTDDSVVSEFLPQVLMNTEYKNFAAQMKFAAEHQDNKEEAVTAAEEGGKFNLSGVYRSRNDLFKVDKDAFDKYLTITKCPWVFKKLFIKTVGTISDVFITMNEDTMEFKYKMPLFGTRSTKYILDDQVRDVMNVWNHARPQRARCDEQKERVVVTIDPHPSLKDGFSRHSFFFKDVDGERVLVWEQYIEDKEAGFKQASEMRFWQVSAARK